MILSKPNAYLTSGRNGEQALVVADRHQHLTSHGDEPLTASAISAGDAFQINHTKPYYRNLVTRIQNNGIMIQSLDEKALSRARRKAAAFASDGQNGREAPKGRGSRDTRRHEGLRPSACPKARNRFGPFAGEFLPDIGSIGLPFPQRPGAFASWTRVTFSRSSALRSTGRANGARASAIMKNGASPSLA